MPRKPRASGADRDSGHRRSACLEAADAAVHRRRDGVLYAAGAVRVLRGIDQKTSAFRKRKQRFFKLPFAFKNQPFGFYPALWGLLMINWNHPAGKRLPQAQKRRKPK